MRRVAALACFVLLTGCGHGDSVRRATEQEQEEIAACKATYPPGRTAFLPLARCELGAAAGYVQELDAPENPVMRKLSDALEKAASDVDAGHMTTDEWRAEAQSRIDGLKPGNKRVKQGVAALL